MAGGVPPRSRIFRSSRSKSTRPLFSRGARREVFAQRAVAVALGEQYVAARVGDTRRELAGFVHLERGEGIVVLALRGLHARQAQARNHLDLIVVGVVHDELETGGGLVEFIRIHLDARGDQGAERRIGRPAVFALELVEQRHAAHGVIAREGFDQFFVTRRGGFRLRVATVLVPAPAAEAAGAERDTRDDPDAIDLEPVLGSFQLFGFAVIAHVDLLKNSSTRAVTSATGYSVWVVSAPRSGLSATTPRASSSSPIISATPRARLVGAAELCLELGRTAMDHDAAARQRVAQALRQGQRAALRRLALRHDEHVGRLGLR